MRITISPTIQTNLQSMSGQTLSPLQIFISDEAAISHLSMFAWLVRICVGIPITPLAATSIFAIGIGQARKERFRSQAKTQPCSSTVFKATRRNLSCQFFIFAAFVLWLIHRSYCSIAKWITMELGKEAKPIGRSSPCDIEMVYHSSW